MMMTTTAKMMIVLILLLSTTSQSFPMAKQNCTADCGGITIPYPLGTTPNCSLNPNFWVTCNKTDNPPKLFLYNTSSQIIDISLDGQMTMMQPIGRICYGGSRNDVTSYNFPYINMSRVLTFNSTANKFTTVGCNSDADLTGMQGFRIGRSGFECPHLCPAAGHVEVNPCANVGCCQVSIPADISEMEITFEPSINTPIEYFHNSCTYGFLVEETAFRSSPKNLTALMNLQELPVVVDWVVSRETSCDEAMKNASTYACASSFSACYQMGGSAGGYRCRCNQGYEGNPYLINGCQDIDECADASLNDCFKKEYCTNTAGNYRCSCPEGYSGNGFRNGHDDECTKNHTEKKHNYVLYYIVIGIVAVIFMCAILLASPFILKALKTRSEKKLKRTYYAKNGGIYLEDKLGKMGSSLPYLVKIYSASDLENATRKFDKSMVIGEGGFGMVYRGILPDNSVVAIKRSKRVDSKQRDQFINEVFVLSQVNHKNIVRLLGCCLEMETPLLVYEFIENGTLSLHIHNEEKASLFKWDMRLKVAADTAAVLSYMHSCAASTPIVHRDVKPGNILLDNNYTAKVSDFGGSRLVPQDSIEQPTKVFGTQGYIDPEYFKKSYLTEKSDVYSFGVVLVELMTGKRAACSDDNKLLSCYFMDKFKENLLSAILDVNIEPGRNMEQISQVAGIAFECLQEKGEDRPTMKDVATHLEGLIVAGNHEENVVNESSNGNGRVVNSTATARDQGTTSEIVECDIEACDSLTMKGGR